MNNEVERFSAVFGDRYVIQAKVGSGGMADVYRALDRKHGRDVAIKLFRPEIGVPLGAERFVREIEIAARLQHPNILPVYDSGSADGALFYIMPYVEGDSLRARLRKEHVLAPEAVLDITRNVADALGWAHQHKIVHRDIKPENILFVAGHAVVADFGIARALDAAGAEQITQVGMGLGTPEYMSPEQAFGEANIDGRSDTYSLACVVYELLTGAPPFTGESARAILVRKTTVQAPPVTHHARASLPPAIDDVIARGLAREAADRYSTVQEFERALREAISPSATGTFRTIARKATASIAVLPFVNLSGKAEDDYLTDGLSDELIHALAKVTGLHVVARTSSFALRGTTEDARGIGERLRVQTLLEGTLRRAANRLRITTQLVDTNTGFEIWSERYDRQLSDVFEVQDSITHAIVESLKVELMPAEGSVEASTDSLPAYERYLEAKYQWNRRTEAGMRRSLELLHEAVEMDPSFAPALAALAESYVTLAIYGQLAPEQAMPPARAAAERALHLRPGLAEAQSAIACVRAMYDWSWHEAEADFAVAIELGPQSPTTFQWYAMNVLVPMGRFSEARAQLLRAKNLDPLSPVVALSWALTHYFQRDYDRAIQAYRDLLNRDPGFGITHFFLGQALIEAGEPAEALAELRRAIELAGDTPEILATLGMAQAASGDAAAARDTLSTLGARAADGYVSPVLIAQLESALGDTDAALTALDHARDVRATDLAWIGVRPAFDALRLDPRFERVAREVHLIPPESTAPV